MIPVVVGALSNIPNVTKESLKEMKFSKSKFSFEKIAEQFC